jgi:hypothetical protein
MNDRELLERAARVAGIAHEGMRERSHEGGGCGLRLAGTMTLWNPLTDDGDALRLAVRLRLDILHNDTQEQDMHIGAYAPHPHHCSAVETMEDESHRPAATRRAIVRAAAAMEKT